jgi:hypothetical protein
MNEATKRYLEELVKDPEETNSKEMNELIAEWGFTPPQDYLDFMSEFICGEGPVGDHSWLTLWNIGDLIDLSAEEYIMRELPDYLMFGRDAADTGYAFNKKNSCIYSFGLMSNFKTDPIRYCGSNFSEFIAYLYIK